MAQKRKRNEEPGQDAGEGDDRPNPTDEPGSDDRLSDEASERIAHDHEIERIKSEYEEGSDE